MNITSLITTLDERHIARVIGIPHDEARMRFPLQSNTVGSFEEFTEVLANYYNHHHVECLSGGRFSFSEAASRAKDIVENEYRRKGGDIVTAFNDAKSGTNGGTRAILDIIAERLKLESVENYIKDVFDRMVAPHSFEAKVEIMRQFIAAFGNQLSTSIQLDRPERYAHEFKILIRAHVTSLQNTSSMFRRL